VTDDVLLVTQYYPPERGAAQVRLGSVVAELTRRGHRVEVVTALPNYPTGRIFPGWRRLPVQSVQEGPVRVIRVWVWAAMGSGVARMANYLSFAVTSLLGLVRARPARWWVVEYPTLFGALPAVVVGRLRRRKVVLLVADLWVDSIVEVGALGAGRSVDLLRAVERWMLRRCDVVTAVTEGVAERLVAKGVDRDRMAWLPNGADTELFAPGEADPGLAEEYGLPADRPYVLYAGTHGYVHGLEVLVDAAELLGPEVTVVLVGGGSEKPALQARARERAVGNVVFLDPVDPAEVARLLRGAVAAVATVRAGDLYRTIRSAKMLPAMSSAVPVVYSGDDEGSRVVAAAGAGVVTPPGDPQALAEAIAGRVADPGRREVLGRAGRRWIEEHASWRRLVADWAERVGMAP
jgi:glycosyltransferase involved in cell wall biosynthesis